MKWHVAVVGAVLAVGLLGAPAVAGDDGITLTYSETNDRDCASLEIRRDGAVTVILPPPIDLYCSTWEPDSNGKTVSAKFETHIGGLTYFAWGVTSWGHICAGGAGGCVSWSAYSGDMWLTDGTDAGTHQQLHISSNHCGYRWLAGDTSLYVHEGCSNDWWRFHGGAGEVLPLAHPRHVTRLGDRLIYTGTDRVHGRELWGSLDGVQSLIKDIRRGPGSSGISGFTTRNGRLVFKANDGSGVKRWVTDGTHNGTHRVVQP